MHRRVMVRVALAAVLAGAAIPAAIAATAGAVTGIAPEAAVAGWPRQLGTAEDEAVHAVAASTGGDVYIAGHTDGGEFPGFGALGNEDAYLARFTSSGRLKWVRPFGTNGTDIAYGVAVSGSNVYVTGYTTGVIPGATGHGGNDAFIVRFDTNGNQKWVRQLGTGANEVGLGLTASGSSIYVSGYTSGAFAGATSAGGFDAFVARFDTGGNEKWVRQLGTPGADSAANVVVTGSSVFVGGSANDAFEGLTNAGGNDGFVARYDTAGTRKWIRQFGTTADDSAEGLAVIASGVVISGYTEGTFATATSQGGTDAFLIRYDATGTQTWVRQLGTSGADDGADVAVSGTTIYLFGSTNGAFDGFANAGSSDSFLARYDALGNRTWARQFGTTGHEYPGGVALRPGDANGGGLVVAGFTDATVWGQASAGGYDAFVATFPR